MTITESKRHFDDGGGIHYQKHKIFLYQEDFDKFEEGFLDAVDKIQELVATGEFKGPSLEHTTDEGEGGPAETGEARRDVEFDDL
jgi:hypothetical protein